MSLNNAKAVIFSIEGCALSDEERSFFADSNPLGFILFARNCKSPEQLRVLTDDLRNSLGRDCPILIDQEGGRVQRLKPPMWRGFPAMKHFGDQAARDMDAALEGLRFTILQMADELSQGGVNVNCAPVLDVLTAATHDAIGDRAFSDDADIAARLGVSVCRSFLAAGITPVMKHIPGHGRAVSDSHKDLPRIDASLEDLRASDFKPFQAVAASDVAQGVWGMAAHIVYSAIDPDLPSSVSPRVIDDIIRGEIGFDGFLLSDDLDMDALAGLGDMPARVSAVIEAGCDAALHCSGRFDEMQEIAKAVPNLTAKARIRLQNSQKSLKLTA